MFGGIGLKKMQAVMKQMGMNQQEIDASKVIIEKNDNKRIVIENPSVTKIKFQGQTSFQISGDEIEESTENEISEQDIKTVMEKTGCSREEAKKTLEKTHDLAEAILELNK